MSTKVTIAYGEPPSTDFHLYYDFADDKYHLAIYGKDVEFASGNDNVNLEIPKDVLTKIIEELKKKDFQLPGNLEYLEQKYEENEEQQNEGWTQS